MRDCDRLYPKPQYELHALQHVGLDTPSFTAEDWYEGGHFPHFSDSHPGVVRVHDPKKATYSLSADFLSAKPGRFLKKHFPHLKANEIADISARTIEESTPSEFGIATTPDDIQTVYETGPKSCMAGPIHKLSPAADWSDPKIHPARAFGAGDLAVAFLRRGSRVTARSLIRPSTQVYNTIYGNKVALDLRLKSLGYSCAEMNDRRWEGSRLLAIPYPNLSIVPPGRTLRHPVFLSPYGDSFNRFNLKQDGETLYLQVVCGYTDSERWDNIYGTNRWKTNPPAYNYTD